MIQMLFSLLLAYSNNLQHLHEMLQLFLENFIHSLKIVLVAFFNLDDIIIHSQNLPFVIASIFLMFSFAMKICQKPNYSFKTLKMHEHSIVLTHCPFVGSRDNILHKNALYHHAQWWSHLACMSKMQTIEAIILNIQIFSLLNIMSYPLSFMIDF